MTKCQECGKKFKVSVSSTIGSIIGMQFGFEIIMILLGGYAAVCFYSFQSLFTMVLAILVGCIVFFALLPKSAKLCPDCSNESAST